MIETTQPYAIFAKEIVLGEGVTIESGTMIGHPDRPLDRVVLGDHVYLGPHSKFLSPVIEIGDFTHVHGYTLANGYEPLTIGRNGWFGQNCVLNSTGRLAIGDNCGVGAYSQLWTHILYGDVLQGCRFDSVAEMNIGNDVWFVGHCIVSPIRAADRSMAMIGSVITRDMDENRVYAGCPAKDMTEKMGPQFKSVSVDEKIAKLSQLRLEFLARNPDARPQSIGIAAAGQIVIEGDSIFDVVDRTYTKRRHVDEVAFMKFLLPRAKFIPL